MKLNKRLVFGIVSLVLAAAIALIGIPAVLRQQTEKTAVLRAAAFIPEGTLITEEMTETVLIAAADLPSGAAVSPDQAAGRYALVDMVAGDWFLPGKIGSESPSAATPFTELKDGEVAVSLSARSLAGSLASGLKTGDIVGICTYRNGSVEAIEELQYVRIIGLADSSGVSLDEPSADGKPVIAAVTFLATHGQAEKMIAIENESPLHIMLVSRGSEERAGKLLEAQRLILESAARRAEDPED